MSMIDKAHEVFSRLFGTMNAEVANRIFVGFQNEVDLGTSGKVKFPVGKPTGSEAIMQGPLGTSRRTGKEINGQPKDKNRVRIRVWRYSESMEEFKKYASSRFADPIKDDPLGVEDITDVTFTKAFHKGDTEWAKVVDYTRLLIEASRGLPGFWSIAIHGVFDFDFVESTDKESGAKFVTLEYWPTQIKGIELIRCFNYPGKIDPRKLPEEVKAKLNDVRNKRSVSTGVSVLKEAKSEADKILEKSGIILPKKGNGGVTF